MALIFLCFLCLSFFISLTCSFPTTSILTLSPIQQPNPSSNSWHFISHVAKLTLDRAHHLKSPHKRPSNVFNGTQKAPIYARSYGGYTVVLSFGTPPQKIPLVFDTGSSLLWVPCTSNYTCTNCTFSGTNPTRIPTFKPKLSSTTRIVGCRNPKCGWFFGPDEQARCSGCDPGLRNCSRPCPTYLLQYGLGATAGVLISDNLDFPGQVVPKFLLGCSLVSARQPEGIAGFGRAPTSLPNQLNLKKFSYCLLSHKFDDKPKSSNLTLTDAGNSGTGELSGIRYAPFRKNPIQSPYDEYYYVNLRKITVGKTPVKLPYKFLRPDPQGHGGVIVDSGSTLTFMDRALFTPLVATFVAQTGHLGRDLTSEARSGFGLCYNISNGGRHVSLPRLAFHFKGGARMVPPVANYFSFAGEGSDALCLTIVSDSGPGSPSEPVGPGIILGNYLQQDFYVEYDLKKQRFGFKKHKCG